MRASTGSSTGGIAAVLDLFPVADEVIADSAGPGKPSRSSGGFARPPYDVVIDAQGLLKSAVLARLAGGRRTDRVLARGAARAGGRAFLLGDRRAARQADHVARQNLQLLRALGIDDTRIEMPVRAVQSEVADDVQQATGLRYGVINPGAGWPNKQWPPEKFGAVAAAIQKSRGLPWVVVWGPGEESLARRVEEASSGSTMLAPPTSLADLMALVQRAAIVVAGDTGPVHLAAAAGTPVVGAVRADQPRAQRPVVAGRTSASRASIAASVTTSGAARRRRGAWTRSRWTRSSSAVERRLRQ